MNPHEQEPTENTETFVAKPTITSLTLHDGAIVPAVKWYGKTIEGTLVPERQFLFPLSEDYANYPMVKHPDAFEVVFIGQIKDWPKEEATQEVADALARGDMEQWAIWVVTPGLHDSQSSRYCISKAFGLNLVIDPNAGIITPRRHADPKPLFDALSRRVNVLVVHNGWDQE